MFMDTFSIGPVVALQDTEQLANPYGYQCSNSCPGHFIEVCIISLTLLLSVRIFCFFSLSLNFNP